MSFCLGKFYFTFRFIYFMSEYMADKTIGICIYEICKLLAHIVNSAYFLLHICKNLKPL